MSRLLSRLLYAFARVCTREVTSGSAADMSDREECLIERDVAFLTQSMRWAIDCGADVRCQKPKSLNF